MESKVRTSEASFLNLIRTESSLNIFFPSTVSQTSARPHRPVAVKGTFFFASFSTSRLRPGKTSGYA